jgi:hypothetical protein
MGGKLVKSRAKKKRKKKPRFGLCLIDKGLQGCLDKLQGFQRMTIPDNDNHLENPY